MYFTALTFSLTISFQLHFVNIIELLLLIEVQVQYNYYHRLQQGTHLLYTIEVGLFHKFPLHEL